MPKDLLSRTLQKDHKQTRVINNKSQYSTAYQKNPKQSELPQVIHIKHLRFSSHGSQVLVMLISENYYVTRQSVPYPIFEI